MEPGGQSYMIIGTGYERRLAIKKSWVQIPAPDSRWIIVKFLTEFEQQICGVESNCTAYSATTTITFHIPVVLEYKEFSTNMIYFQV